MHILREGDYRVNKLLRKQEKKQLEYRFMKYCIQASYKGVILLYNGLTKKLVAVGKDEMDMERENLIDAYFLVPVDFDEKTLVEELSSIITLLDSKKKALTNFTIFTTTECNARCPYCFEKGAHKESMSRETAELLSAFILKESLGKPISIRWFGGEPLLNVQVMDVISRRLKHSNASYSSTVVSNGFLFNTQIIRLANELWHTNKVQITLDGTEETYNRTKNYTGCCHNPFQQVLKNIGALCDAGIDVNIRLNVSNSNTNNLQELLQYLLNSNLDKQHISISVHTLFERKGTLYRLRDEAEEQMVRMAEINLLNTVWENGFYKETLPHFFRAFNCAAAQRQLVTILPSGHIGLCEHRIESGFIGDIRDSHWRYTLPSSYKEKTVVDTSCFDCPLWIDCNRQKNCDAVTSRCTHWKRENLCNDYQLRMKVIYDNYRGGSEQ